MWRAAGPIFLTAAQKRPVTTLPTSNACLIVALVRRPSFRGTVIPRLMLTFAPCNLFFLNSTVQQKEEIRMTIALAYRDTKTQLLWFVAGMTDLSVIVKNGSLAVCRYIDRDEFALLTNTGRLVAV